MRNLDRREFLQAALAGGGMLFAPRTAAAADARIEVLVDEPIAAIHPDLHGHFIEHLGGVIYDGIWVGEESKVANVGGIRKELVDQMRRLRPPVMRWPGGCFADSYDWRDGIGPRGSRPRRTNFWIDSPSIRDTDDGPHKYEPNSFGTNEFMQLCRLVGAKPYLAVNLRSLPARDFYQWIEYCNAPAGRTTLSGLRAQAGEGDPFDVRYWGIGNESWGCGGNFTPEEYATEYRRFTAWAPRYGKPLSFIAAGPSSGDLDWTRGFFRKLTERGARQLGSLYGWALHHYTWNVSMGRTSDWVAGKGDALVFSLEEWYELLREADRMESLITSHWAVMGETDREHRVKLAVDEWGVWHRPGTEVDPAYLFSQGSTLRDALVAALTLDIFHRHADKVVMGNVAQLVNCLHSLFLAREDRFVLTPTFHVFEMYASHQGAQSLRTQFSAPRIPYGRGDQGASIWGLAGSASLRDRDAVLTVVNPHATEPRETEIVLRGAGIRSAGARTLGGGDLRAHNTFERPRALEPHDDQVRVSASGLHYRFPPASVTRLRISLT